VGEKRITSNDKRSVRWTNDKQIKHYITGLNCIEIIYIRKHKYVMKVMQMLSFIDQAICIIYDCVAYLHVEAHIMAYNDEVVLLTRELIIGTPFSKRRFGVCTNDCYE